MGNLNQHKPVIDTKTKKIDQIGIVVRDAHKTARMYSEIFGIGPWVFIDFAATDVLFQNAGIEDGSSLIRAAMADLGGVQIELLQPLYGKGTHAAFLKERGEGIHHVSFGMVEDHDPAVSAMVRKGIRVEMSGVLGGEVRFTYMDTLNELGTIFELVKPPAGDLKSLKPWGTFQPPGPGLINFEGRKIRQIGIVVEDAEKAAKNYWDLFGVGPWILVDFKNPHLTGAALHGITLLDGIDFHVRAALADMGEMQIELLEPVSGPSTYMEFLKNVGQGIHHVSFGETDDHDEVVSVLQNHGMDIEMTGILGGAVRFTYMATQKKLGTIFEVIKTDHEAVMTLVPYGTYPLQT
jgi:catechol 2,3-dioxygenase-like lactoylglutathione lyase family enzyme